MGEWDLRGRVRKGKRCLYKLGREVKAGKILRDLMLLRLTQYQILEM
jgi:hypothetical protein